MVLVKPEVAHSWQSEGPGADSSVPVCMQELPYIHQIALQLPKAQICCWSNFAAGNFFVCCCNARCLQMFGTSARGVAEHQTIVGCSASCIEFCKQLNTGLGCTLLKAILRIVAAARHALCAFYRLRSFKNVLPKIFRAIETIALRLAVRAPAAEFVD